ncbi:hypothetical protein EDD18DRAFT_1356137 [Armillaria luteobubalina]|uniref:Uncharacterized protein n=1 Tax=Armillaria luteobubalina TaxID=153913 RepID=A0AA39UUQ5_9AGAR|nr:hypothetical protein EDD18DRAFT_1356137 [Armillaria luteobubalina]
MPITRESYLSSLDSTQISELISALEQCGLVLAPATLPTTPGPILLAASNHQSHAPSTLSGGKATLSIADIATSLAVIPETNGKPLLQPNKPMVTRKASRGRLTGSQGQQGCPSTWYMVTVGNAITPSVVDVDGTVYLAHPSHVAASAHYANAMANDAVEIVLTDSDNDA